MSRRSRGRSRHVLAIHWFKSTVTKICTDAWLWWHWNVRNAVQHGMMCRNVDRYRAVCAVFIDRRDCIIDKLFGFVQDGLVHDSSLWPNLLNSVVDFPTQDLWIYWSYSPQNSCGVLLYKREQVHISEWTRTSNFTFRPSMIIWHQQIC